MSWFGKWDGFDEETQNAPDIFVRKPQTNYDRIISKTPEELAEWINNEYGSTDWCPVDAPVDPVTRMCLVHDDCTECIVDWLKQEVKDHE